MSTPRLVLSLLVVAVLASGCLANVSSAGNPSPDDASPPQGDNAGTPAQHGSPKRVDGAVEIDRQGSQVVARKTVTVDNDFGGAERSHVVLSTFNGAIGVQASQDGGYHLTAVLYGRGQTEEEARQALDLLRLQTTDELKGNLLELSFALTANTPSIVPLPVVLPTGGANNGAAYQLALPPEPGHDLEAGTTNGAITVGALHGPHLKAGSTNGALSANGAFDRFEGSTTNGGISLDGTFNDVTAHTSNGAISGELAWTRSGTVKLETSNGAIAVDLPRDAAAFDITADTTNGRIVFDVDGHESTHRDHAEYRSSDWSSADVKVTLDLGTTNGSITVED